MARSDYSELMEEKSHFHRKGNTGIFAFRRRNQCLHNAHVTFGIRWLAVVARYPRMETAVAVFVIALGSQWSMAYVGTIFRGALRGRCERHAYRFSWQRIIPLGKPLTPPWPSLYPSDTDQGAVDEGDVIDVDAADRLRLVDQGKFGLLLQLRKSMVRKLSMRWNRLPRLAVLTPFRVAQLDAVFEASIEALARWWVRPTTPVVKLHHSRR